MRSRPKPRGGLCAQRRGWGIFDLCPQAALELLPQLVRAAGNSVVQGTGDSVTWATRKPCFRLVSSTAFGFVSSTHSSAQYPRALSARSPVPVSCLELTVKKAKTHPGPLRWGQTWETLKMKVSISFVPLLDERRRRPTKVGPPERDKTEGSQELNDVWVRG